MCTNIYLIKNTFLSGIMPQGLQALLSSCSKSHLRGTLMRGHPVIRESFLGTVSYLPHVKESVIKGHFRAT